MAYKPKQFRLFKTEDQVQVVSDQIRDLEGQRFQQEIFGIQARAAANSEGANEDQVKGFTSTAEAHEFAVREADNRLAELYAIHDALTAKPAPPASPSQ